jgi:hypothetical protein
MIIQSKENYGFDNLFNRDDWEKIQGILLGLEKHYKLDPCPPPALDEFEIFKAKQSTRLIGAWRIIKDHHQFVLCLLDYAHSYESAGNQGGFIHTDVDKYFWGYLQSNVNAEPTYIRPESLRDKILELFHSTETKIPAYPEFSKKFYVLSASGNGRIPWLSNELVTLLDNNRTIEIEFRGRSCLFKRSKPIAIDEARMLCDFGLALDGVLP